MSVTKVPMRGVNTAVDTAAGDDANIGYTSAEGLILTGQGSTNDVTIKNDADTNILKVATGTTVVDFATSVTVANDITVATAGEVFVGDTAAANVTSGLTLNQAAADNNIIELKSSDVAHGFTDMAETDSYGLVRKVNTTVAGGGLEIMGIAETSQGLLLRGLGGTVGTGDTTSTTGQVTIEGSTDNGGTNIGTLAADNNVLAIRNNLTTRWVIKGDGDVHQTTDAHTTLDAFDDALVCRQFDFEFADPASIIKSKWDTFINAKDRKELLIKAGLISRMSDEDEAIGASPLFNASQLQRLHNGAIGQLSDKIKEQGMQIQALQNQIGILPTIKRLLLGN